jgi:transposase InsO family protein
MVGPVAKREGVAHLQAVMGLSERRACSIVDADRKMIRYRSRRAPDRELRTQLRDLANARRRFGYRRLFILLRQEGEPSGINRIYRLYREEGLTVRKRRGRRRAVGTRPILLQEVGQPIPGRTTRCIVGPATPGMAADVVALGEPMSGRLAFAQFSPSQPIPPRASNWLRAARAYSSRRRPPLP